MTKDSRCIFAAGTSGTTVQSVFRIGRTISTRMSKADYHACTLPKDSGGCDNKIFRYYYNAIEVRIRSWHMVAGMHIALAATNMVVEFRER